MSNNRSGNEMRQGSGSKRSRRQGRRGNPAPRHHNFDSNGPDVRVRGNAMQVHEKYLTLARDAGSAGDRVKAESYFQHAEHYFRIHHEELEQIEARRVQRDGMSERDGNHDGYGEDAYGADAEEQEAGPARRPRRSRPNQRDERQSGESHQDERHSDERQEDERRADERGAPETDAGEGDQDDVDEGVAATLARGRRGRPRRRPANGHGAEANGHDASAGAGGSSSGGDDDMPGRDDSDRDRDEDGRGTSNLL